MTWTDVYKRQNVDKSGIVYNADLLEKLGKEVPKTWDEFLDACEEAKNQGYTPVYLAGKDPGKLAGVINTVSPTYLITDSTQIGTPLVAGFSEGNADEIASGVILQGDTVEALSEACLLYTSRCV